MNYSLESHLVVTHNLSVLMSEMMKQHEFFRENGNNNNNNNYNNTKMIRTLSDHVFLFIYALIFLVGLVGNFLVIYFVLFYKRMQTITNKLITNLSIADLLVIFFCVPVTASQHVSRNWLFGEVVCRASGFVQGKLSY